MQCWIEQLLCYFLFLVKKKYCKKNWVNTQNPEDRICNFYIWEAHNWISIFSVIKPYSVVWFQSNGKKLVLWFLFIRLSGFGLMTLSHIEHCRLGPTKRLTWESSAPGTKCFCLPIWPPQWPFEGMCCSPLERRCFLKKIMYGKYVRMYLHKHHSISGHLATLRALPSGNPAWKSPSPFHYVISLHL